MTTDCPIPNTHRRLDQAHLLWHQTLEAYDDPDLFQANLNATIEALRNVTFMLQSEKGQIPDFDPWYEGCRDALKADEVTAWLHDARTTVVHKADLETSSTAIARVQNNLDLATISATLPPLMPTRVACHLLAEKLPEPFASNPTDLILSVERRWCTAGLPDWELLDALAHAYGVLAIIVAEAHQKAGRPFRMRDHDGNLTKISGDRLPCMITTTELRTSRIALEDGRHLVATHTPVEFDPASIPDLQERFGPMPEPLAAGSGPFEFAEALLPIAKRVLSSDGYHVRIMHIRTPEGWVIRGINADTRVDKYSILKTLANETHALRGDAVVEIGEAWAAPLEELKAGHLPEVAEGRGEVLLVSVATSKGEFRSYDTPFTRDSSGTIVLADTEVRYAPMPTYMAPFCEVWGLPAPKAAEEGLA